MSMIFSLLRYDLLAVFVVLRTIYGFRPDLKCVPALRSLAAKR